MTNILCHIKFLWFDFRHDSLTNFRISSRSTKCIPKYQNVGTQIPNARTTKIKFSMPIVWTPPIFCVPCSVYVFSKMRVKKIKKVSSLMVSKNLLKRALVVKWLLLSFGDGTILLAIASFSLNKHAFVGVKPARMNSPTKTTFWHAVGPKLLKYG